MPNLDIRQTCVSQMRTATTARLGIKLQQSRKRTRTAMTKSHAVMKTILELPVKSRALYSNAREKPPRGHARMECPQQKHSTLSSRLQELGELDLGLHSHRKRKVSDLLVRNHVPLSDLSRKTLKKYIVRGLFDARQE